MQSEGQTRQVLADVIRLHFLKRVESQLAWYVGEGILPIQACKAVPELVRQVLLSVLQWPGIYSLCPMSEPIHLYDGMPQCAQVITHTVLKSGCSVAQDCDCHACMGASGHLLHYIWQSVSWSFDVPTRWGWISSVCINETFPVVGLSARP